MTHELKTWPEFFAGVKSGRKTFEIRKYDRGFKVGDILRLREWDYHAEAYTGEELEREVTYVLCGGPYLAEGYCCMGIKEADSDVE